MIKINDLTSDMKVAIVPAQPGWFALQPWQAPDPKDIGWMRTPIIAWRIETGVTHDRSSFYTTAYPILAETQCSIESGAESILLRPDGQVCYDSDRTFDTEAEALDFYREEVVRVRAERVEGAKR